jgi:hypothetical protein
MKMMQTLLFQEICANMVVFLSFEYGRRVMSHYKKKQAKKT